MGKSNSIEKQQKSNKAFEEYITAMNADMEKHLGKTSDTLDGMVKNHYELFPDKAMLMEGRYSHLTTLSEWSLASVDKIIDGCRGAIFGKKAPAGTEKSETPTEVSVSIEAIRKRELFIANAAFDVVQSIMATFNNSTSTSVESKLDAKPLSPGLTLFIGVMNNSFSRKDFFRNETIMQNMFVFKVFYSIKEGQAQSRLNDLEAYEDQKTAFRNNLKKLNDTVSGLDILADSYLADLKKFTTIADAVNARLKDLDAKIAELAADRAAPDASSARIDIVSSERCEAIVSSLRHRWNAAYQSWKSSQ